MIDLRSDTVTKPTPKMLVSMTSADVGDDVFAEDETVNTFQQQMADMFGFEAGLFVPSGTMSNQLGIAVLTEPGDEVLIDEKGHMINYETGASPVLSGVQLMPLAGERGKLSVDAIRNRVRGSYDWEARTKVIALENATNKGGGACYQKDELKAIKEFADASDLYIHMDGARLWNAMTATDIEPDFFGNISETLSICFSKGLGAPVGSMLLSTAERIAKARRYRKMWGGGMRQVGILAAAANFAVKNNRDLLKDDHRRAKAFAELVNEMSKFHIDPSTVETNVVLFDVTDGSVPEVLNQLNEHQIRMVQFGPKTIRATFHFQITDQHMEKLRSVFFELFS